MLFRKLIHSTLESGSESDTPRDPWEENLQTVKDEEVEAFSFKNINPCLQNSVIKLIV